MPRKRKYPSLDLKPWVTTVTLNMPGKGKPGGLEALKAALLGLPQLADPAKAAVEENDKLWERVIAITRRQKDAVILGLTTRRGELASDVLHLTAQNARLRSELLDRAHEQAFLENLQRSFTLKVGDVFRPAHEWTYYPAIFPPATVTTAPIPIRLDFKA